MGECWFYREFFFFFGGGGGGWFFLSTFPAMRCSATAYVYYGRVVLSLARLSPMDLRLTIADIPLPDTHGVVPGPVRARRPAGGRGAEEEGVIPGSRPQGSILLALQGGSQESDPGEGGRGDEVVIYCYLPIF